MPEKGLSFSENAYVLMNKIKKFNYKNIYHSNRMQSSNRFFNIVINEIYDTLKSCFNGKSALNSIENLKKFYPKLYKDFSEFLYSYTNFPEREISNLKNEILFEDSNIIDFCKAILYFIAGMTDNYAIEIYNEIISF